MFETEKMVEAEKENRQQAIRWDCLNLAADKFVTGSDEAPRIADGFYQYVVNGTISPITIPETLPLASQVPPIDTIPAA